MTKNKLERFAEMKTFSNVIEPSFEEIFNADYKLKGKWHKIYFQNNHPIILELGCGKGEYTVNLAREYPDKNFIGIDIKGARMWKGAKKANEENIPNALFLRTRVDFINSFFDTDEIDEIWITFPDPQPKKAKKRLVSTKFLSYYQHFLKDNGIIHLKTDNTDVYEYGCKITDLNNLHVLKNTRDIHNSEDEELKPIREIQTFYEQMFLDEGKTIKYLSFKLNKEKELLEPKDDK